MRTENMKTRLGGVTILRAGAAMALVAALTACGGGGGGTPPVQEPTAEEIAAQEKAARQTTQRGAISTAIATARGLVDGLDDDSTAADVAAAEAAIAAIRTAIAGAADLEDSETGLNTLTADGLAAHVTLHQTQGSQRTTATGAIETARTAVAGLSDGSSTNQQVMAAIEDAKKAIAAATDLSETQTDAYTAQVTGFESTFMTHRQGQQRDAITAAIADARTKVGALNSRSSGDDAQAAADAVEEANKAIAAAVDITDTSAYSSEVTGINGDLTTHNTKQTQRAAITTAHDEAVDAVDALDTATSSSKDVADAQALVDAAKNAITAASALPPEEVDLLNSRIDLVENQLDGIGTDVAARETDEENDRRRLAEDNDEADDLRDDLAGDRDLLEDYENASDQALTDAGDYADKLDVLSVKGDSETAKANAQKVLDAKDTIAAELAKAEEILKDARDDQAKIAALDDETDGKAALERLAGYVISDAEAVIEEIKGHMEDYEDEGYEFQVGSEDKRTAQEAANVVASAIKGILDSEADEVLGYATLSDSVDGVASGNRFESQDGVDEVIEKGFKLSSLPRSARTFEDIFGLRRGVAGMDLDDLTTGNFTDNADIDSGDSIGQDQSTPVRFRGIPVVLECGGTCSIDADDDDKLVGDWFVEPHAPDALYASGPNGNFVDSVFVEYAHWLSGPENAPVLNLYSARGIGSAALGSATLGTGDIDDLDNSTATFTGEAAGMSVHDTNGEAAGGLASGSFTADVRLEAEFGDSAMVSGRIDGFEGGANVDTGWWITLEEKAYSDSNIGNLNTAAAGPDNGGWTARAYGGTAAQRPTGVYGTFDAEFADGQARGVYVTD